MGAGVARDGGCNVGGYCVGGCCRFPYSITIVYYSNVKDRSVLDGLYTGVPLGPRRFTKTGLAGTQLYWKSQNNTGVDAESRRGARVE